MDLETRAGMPSRLVLALDRLLRPDQHETLRILDGQRLMVADVLAYSGAVDGDDPRSR